MARVEYLTLAIGNAKSNGGSSTKTGPSGPILTDLEEKLEVAQIQVEMYNTLLPRAEEPGEVGAKVQVLAKTLLSISEVCISLDIALF